MSAINGVSLLAGQTYYIIISTWPAPNCTPFTININGTKNRICLNSSYKFALKNINKKIIPVIVSKIDPKTICLFELDKIFFSTKGNTHKPIKLIRGSLKKSQIKI